MKRHTCSPRTASLRRERHTGGWLLGLLLASLALAGCGPPRAGLHEPTPVPAPPAPGVVVIHNGTPDQLDVRLDGALVGSVRPGATIRTGPVVAGRHRMVAEDPRSGVAYTEDVEVPAGFEARWSIRAGYGVVEVENLGPAGVVVEMDGRELGRVAGGGRERFGSVPAGMRHLVARRADGRVLREETVLVAVRGTVRWTIAPVAPPPAPRRASLEVFNRAPEPVEVRLDGEPLGRVKAGERKRFGRLRAGPARVSAVTRAGQPVARAELHLRPGQLAVWEVVPPSCRLEVRNETRRRFAIDVDGRPQGNVTPGSVVVFEGIPAGRRTVRARRPDGAARQVEVQCTPGGIARWRLTPPPRAALDVVNHTGALFELREEGRVIGRVAPGATRRFGNLRPGRRRFEARGAGVPPSVRDIVLRAGAVERWVVEAPFATLVVRNPTRRPATIYLDGRELGSVAAGGRARFERLRAGRHRLRVVRRGLPDHVESIALVEGRVTRWRVPKAGRAELPAVKPRRTAVAATSSTVSPPSAFAPKLRARPGAP